MNKKMFIAPALLLGLSSVLSACGGETATVVPVATSTTAMMQPTGTTAMMQPTGTTAMAESTGTTAMMQPTGTTAMAESTGTTAMMQPTGTTSVTGAMASPASGKKFTIGVSNPFISSEYRTQMIQELNDTNKEYKDKGITNDLVIESADTDVAGQIQQLQNLMSKNVDAILVNPGDVNGLNATLQEAVKKGIIVISVDQELATPNVYNVGIDQKEWAKISAKWLADKLAGKGNIVEIEGFPGHPANVARQSGVDEVLANYPGIKVLGKDSGKWDEATGQQVMSNFLASFPNMDGYWTQDGMAIGAFQAVLAANPAKFPVSVLEGRCQALQLWDQRLKVDPTFESIAVANPPGAASTGLRIAVNMLMGKKVDTSTMGGTNKQSFVIPIPVTVTKDNFQQVYSTACKDKPASYLLDGILSDQEVQKYFQK